MPESEDDDVSFPLLIDDDELTNGADNEDILDEDGEEVDQAEDTVGNDPDNDDKSVENYSTTGKKSSDTNRPMEQLQSDGHIVSISNYA